MGYQIDPNTFYEKHDVRRLTKVSSHAIGAAVRAGELRASKIGSRQVFKGQWLIDWLEGNGDAVAADQARDAEGYGNA